MRSPEAGGLARWTLALAPAYFIGFAALLFLFYRHDHPMWTDAWRLYELAQTVFGDFYRSNYVATYQTLNTGGYSADFPPLWPVVLAVTDNLLHTGPNSGYVAAFLCLALFMVVSELVARELTGVPAVGFAVAGIVVASWWFQVELLAGQTMPMQLLLLSVILYVFVLAGPLGAARCLVLGVLCGLAFLNRFDALPFAIAMIAMCGVTAETWRGAPVFVVGLLLGMSPWISYSLAHFGTLLASDNRTVALAAVATHTTEWYATPLPTVFDQPVAWAFKLARFTGRLGVGLVQAFLGIAALPVVFLAALVVRAGARGERPSEVTARFGDLGPQGLRFGLFGIALWLSLSAQLLTGYGYQARYFAAHVWWTGLGAAMLSFRVFAPSKAERTAAAALFVALAMVGAAVTWLAEQQGLVHTWSPKDSSGKMISADTEATFKAVAECVRNSGGRRVLIPDNENAVRFATLTKVPTIAAPTNFDRLSPDELGLFLAQYRVDLVLAFAPKEEQAFIRRQPARRVAGCSPTVLDVRRP